MKSMSRVAAVAAGLLLVAVLAGPAFAGHDHWLQTPGTCVEDLASGQTAQTTGGGAHRFHDNVHLGVPGTTAFAKTPVSVGKVVTVPCPIAG